MLPYEPMQQPAKAFVPVAANSMNDYSQMPEQAAQAYDATLSVHDRDIGGCYTHRCVMFGNCCTGCSYNMQCGDCVWPINSYVPFSLFMGCLSKLPAGQGWVNLKGDTHVYKIDASSGTLGCYVGSTMCCVCSKV
jgi:hypothetical protein